MKPFMCEDFLLSSDTARLLYHNYAEQMSIVDYHCHLNPEHIAKDKRFKSITEAWLDGDHYKWRLMRSKGVSERLITGDADDFEKFEAWAGTLPLAIGNPLYHWSHLELKRYFGYDGVLNKHTARSVWDICNKNLENMSARSIIKQSNVTHICTTDDPADDLRWHDETAADHSFGVKVLPAWRPDKALNIGNDGFREYICKLSAAAGKEINSLETLFGALSARMDYFAARGCVATDHGLDAIVYAPCGGGKPDDIFKNRLNGGACTESEADIYKFALMRFLAGEYSRRGWVMELHYGANRSVNGRMLKLLGPDAGFDCISGVNCAKETAAFLNELHEAGILPKTIIFSLNPNDDAAIGSIIGCFQSEGVLGKIQQGSAWWFNDSKGGMNAQMTSLANSSLFGAFLGMLTDSRSFLSYTRHEYFRRILCEFIGGLVENGEYPFDIDGLKALVEGICYNNAVDYFGFGRI